MFTKSSTASPVLSPRRSSLETWSVRALVITLIAAAIVVIPTASFPFAATKSLMLAAGVIITLALFILARLSRGNVVLPPLALVGVLWLPFIAYALSTAFSGESFENAFWGTALETDTMGFMLVVALLGTLAALVLRRSEQYRSALKAFAWGALALAVIQTLIIIVGQFAPETISPAYAVIGSFEDLAAVLGLGVVGALITLRFIDIPERFRRWIMMGGAMALLVLVVANSSLVWILLALVSLGLFVESVMRMRTSDADGDLDETTVVDETPSVADSGNHSLALPLSVLTISLFFLVGGTLSGALANALNINVLNVRPSWQSTIDVGSQVYKSSSVFGSGPNTFGVEWLKHRDPSLNATVFWNVDFNSGIGFIPTSFVTTGIVGALAWILMLVLLLGLGIRMLILRAPEDPFVRYTAILSFIAMVYLFAIAIFGLPGTVVLALAFVFAGLFASTMRYAARASQWGIIFYRSPRIGFIIVFSLTLLLLASVVAAYTLIGRYIATTELARAVVAHSVGDLGGANNALQSSITFAPSASAYQLQANIANTLLSQIIASTTMPTATAQQAFQSALSTGINSALTATQLDPNNYQNWILLGNMYAQAVPLKVSGAYDSAKTAYTKATELNPTNPQIPYTLAQLDIANNDNVAAEKNLKIAISLKQDYTAAIFLLSQLQVQDGNVKEALASALAAAYFTPNNPNILFQVGVLSAASGDLASAVSALSAAIAANPQFANARYFLSAVYAKQGNMAEALKEMQAIAAMSDDNAKAVAAQLAALEQSKNPFPANLLTISPAPAQ